MITADVIAYLEAEGVTALFAEELSPQNRQLERVVVVASYGGREPGLVHDGADSRTDRPRFQVAVTDPDPIVARELAQDIQNRLARVSNRELSGTWYLSILPLQTPFFLRTLEDERFTYVANYEAEKAVDVVGS